MLALRALLGLSIAGQVALACWLWPTLPERIPTHFGADGTPDGFGSKDAEWFVISAVLAVLGAVIGFGLPWFVRRLAARNSSWLNVPDRARFAALPEDVRVRAVGAAEPWFAAIGVELQLLMAFLLWGTARVAQQEWAGLPPVPLYGALLAMLGTAVALAVQGSRAVRRELAAARGSG